MTNNEAIDIPDYWYTIDDLIKYWKDNEKYTPLTYDKSTWNYLSLAFVVALKKLKEKYNLRTSSPEGNWIDKAREQFSKMEYYGVDSEIFSKGEPYSKETFIHAIQDNLPKPEGYVDAIIDNISNEWICLEDDDKYGDIGKISKDKLRQILTKHLGEGKEEVEMCESEGDCVCPFCGAFDVKNYCPWCGVKIKRVEQEGEQKGGKCKECDGTGIYFSSYSLGGGWTNSFCLCPIGRKKEKEYTNKLKPKKAGKCKKLLRYYKNNNSHNPPTSGPDSGQP